MAESDSSSSMGACGGVYGLARIWCDRNNNDSDNNSNNNNNNNHNHSVSRASNILRACVCTAWRKFVARMDVGRKHSGPRISHYWALEGGPKHHSHSNMASSGESIHAGGKLQGGRACHLKRLDLRVLFGKGLKRSRLTSTAPLRLFVRVVVFDAPVQCARDVVAVVPSVMLNINL